MYVYLYMHLYIQTLTFCSDGRLLKTKEWTDQNDPGSTIIPFSGALETGLISVTEPEQREAMLKDKGATRSVRCQFYSLFISMNSKTHVLPLALQLSTCIYSSLIKSNIKNMYFQTAYKIELIYRYILYIYTYEYPIPVCTVIMPSRGD